MKRTITLTNLILAIMFLVACGEASKDKKADLNDKRSELRKLKTEQSELRTKIAELEAEIALADPNASKAQPKLVNTTAIQLGDFTHYIDLQGFITTENIYYVSPRGQGGQVKAIYVKEGQPVRKGQLVMKLDDAIVRQQIEQAKIQLNYLEDLYQRRKNLWDQNIGTEVELISARNAVTNAEKQVSLLNEQLAMSNVYSEVSGIVEKVSIRVGEILSPQSAAAAGIRIVNNTNLKASVNIPENYLSRVSKGTPVIVEIPDINKKFKSTISLISQVISTTDRGFTAEAKVPADPALKPNQIAMVRIQDYKRSNAVVIPLNVVQTDEKGKYVLVAAQEGNNRIARKKPIELGELYRDSIEVRSGLQAGDELITEGFQSLYEGQPISTTVR